MSFTTDFGHNVTQTETNIITRNNLTINTDSLYMGVWLPVSINKVGGSCLMIISILGVTFNIFMVVAIATNRRLRTVRNVLLLHLGSVGLLSSVFTTMYPALATFHGRWLGGVSMCQAHACMTCMFTSVSVWTITALSWDKYQTIIAPLHYSLAPTLHKMVSCFTAFWICGLALSLPPLFGATDFFYHSPDVICGMNITSTASRLYTCMLVCVSFVFPFCLMVYCYAHIFSIARSQSTRIAATMLRMVSVIQAPITSSNQSSLSLNGTKAIGTILQLIGSFMFTYLPYALIILYEVIFTSHANAIFVSIATICFLSAPFTHAAIYGVKNQNLRSSFRRYTRRKMQHCCVKDTRRGSVKRLTRKPSSAFTMPMKCLIRNDERQCILSKTISRPSKPLDLQVGAFENKATSLSRPHSCDLLEEANEWSPSCLNNLMLENGNDSKKKTQDIYSDFDNVLYIHPDLVSCLSRHEISYYRKEISIDLSATNWDVEDETKLNQQSMECQHDQRFIDDSSSEDGSEELSKLCPDKEVAISPEVKNSKKKSTFLKDLHRYRRSKKTSKLRGRFIVQEESFTIHTEPRRTKLNQRINKELSQI